MKGIVLAGGLGTRLNPVTKVLNKHILPVDDKPMFYHPLGTLIRSGIKQVAVVSGPPFGNQIRELLRYFPFPETVKSIYIDQPSPAGMPDGIMRCKAFVQKESVIVIAGDNLYDLDFTTEIKNFSSGALSFLRKTSDAHRFGVPIYDIDGKLIGIVEKPINLVSEWAVTGPHIFDNRVFDMIGNLKPSDRRELEISDLNFEYIKLGQLKLVKRSDYWVDMGTFESLLTAGEHAHSKMKQ